MKTRLDETNQMRKLMGLDLIKEEKQIISEGAVIDSGKVIYPDIQQENKYVTYKVEITQKAKGDKPLVVKLHMDRNKTVELVDKSSGLYKKDKEGEYHVAESFMDVWYPIFKKVIQLYANKSNHKITEVSNTGWTAKATKGGEETTISIKPAEGNYDSKQNDREFYFTIGSDAGQQTQDSQSKEGEEQEGEMDGFNLKTFCDNARGTFKEVGDSSFCVWRSKSGTIVTGINIGGSTVSSIGKDKKAQRKGVWGFDSSIEPEIKKVVKVFRGLKSDNYNLTVHKVKTRIKKDPVVIDVLVGAS